ncbi:MerR family transcriptional regulator [Micromonospora zhanjiangensis]|uniref:MerR family transcriptional regulator n=1 Tax=Micromonospora zhanjiangensis TaxID=1522057 RepID=A0ABV8KVQ8_9ACTN
MADDVPLSAGAVARRLGVAVTTLRTWHQRYGLGPSQHVPGHHRRYTAEDLARLEIMRKLTAEGVSPAEAARWARRAPGVPEGEPAWPRRRWAAQRAGSGPPSGPATRGLLRAAVRLDPVGVRETAERLIAADGVVDAWEAVFAPVLIGIGERFAATGGDIEVEHLLSRCLSEAFAAVPRPAGTAGAPRVLLACADEEQHSLPLEALAAALAQVAVPTRALGARVPLPALLEVVDRTGPAAVVIWAHSPATGDPGQLVALLARPRRPLLVLAAGPGWLADLLPAGVVRPNSLAEAVLLAVAVCESAGRSATG